MFSHRLGFALGFRCEAVLALGFEADGFSPFGVFVEPVGLGFWVSCGFPLGLPLSAPSGFVLLGLRCRWPFGGARPPGP